MRRQVAICTVCRRGGAEDDRRHLARGRRDRSTPGSALRHQLVDMGGPGPVRAHDVLVGRSRQVLADWLAVRPESCRAGVEVGALEPYAPYRCAVREQLPHAMMVVDTFHGIRLFNAALGAVRRRLSQQQPGRRGRRPTRRGGHGTACCGRTSG